jgi:hypothetical protein
MGENFEKEGFLSDETEEIKKIIFNRYHLTFAKCSEVNQIAHQYRNSFNLDYENELHVVLVCMIQRILDSFHAVVILMSIGLSHDSDIITRSAVEAMLQIRKLATDENSGCPITSGQAKIKNKRL